MGYESKPRDPTLPKGFDYEAFEVIITRGNYMTFILNNMALIGHHLKLVDQSNLVDESALRSLLTTLSWCFRDPLNGYVHDITIAAVQDAITWMATTPADKVAQACGWPTYERCEGRRQGVCPCCTTVTPNLANYNRQLKVVVEEVHPLAP